MRSILEKMVVAEAKIELLNRFIEDLKALPEEVKPKYSKKIVNYERMLHVEKNKIAEVLKCIQKQYPHECRCK